MPPSSEPHPLPVKAVILDYGQVVSLAPDPEEMASLAAVLAVPRDVFCNLYPRDRAPYDQGTVTPDEYWFRFAEKVGVALDTKKVVKLRSLDVAMWSSVNPQMIRWIETLSAAGLKTALLSNMISDMALHARKNFPWMSHLTCQVLSCEVGLIKPDPVIYERCLRELAVAPSEALFVDDIEANVLAARSLGIRSIRFASMAQLLNEILSCGLGIPLPAPALLPPERSNDGLAS